jgi:hypothetical protein
MARKRHNCNVKSGPVRWVTYWMGQQATQPAVPDRTWYRLLGSVQMCAHRKQKANWFLHKDRKYRVTKTNSSSGRETIVIQHQLSQYNSIYTPISTPEIPVKFLRHAQSSTLQENRNRTVNVICKILKEEEYEDFWNQIGWTVRFGVVELNTAEPGYNDIGLRDTSYITSHVPWYQLIPHCYP